jgi:hypothetical protein
MCQPYICSLQIIKEKGNQHVKLNKSTCIGIGCDVTDDSKRKNSATQNHVLFLLLKKILLINYF